MPEYVFRTRKGNVVTAFMGVDEVPCIGEWALVEGVDCVRLPTIPQACVVPDRLVVSRSLPRWDPSASQYDDQGRPVFTSWKSIKEYEAKASDNDGTQVVYDGI